MCDLHLFILSRTASVSSLPVRIPLTVFMGKVIRTGKWGVQGPRCACLFVIGLN